MPESNLDLTSTITGTSTILIDNFSMDVEEWKYVSELAYFAIDVIDHSYPISVSGTYFLHDGQVKSTVLSGIADGYRAYYYPTDVSSSGTITITIHAENSQDEKQNSSYFLLYGYHVKFNEVMDWGPAKTIVTIAKATNLAFCPNTVGEASYFETADLPSVRLGAYINPVPSVDLGAVIYPQSSFFFYGRTYTVTVSGVKDYSGNTMEPYTFTFTIENPN